MTYSFDVFNQEGKKLKPIAANAAVFSDDRINESAIAEFARLQMANERIAIANTKTRGQVAGSGKKLYRQKGTGSGRVGDKKSPLRKKGWVVFGPTSQRNYSIDLPKKIRKLALASLITKKFQGGMALGLDKFSFKETKTKNAVNVLGNLGLGNDKVLVVVPEANESLKKSFSNLPKVKVLLASYLNPRDLLNYSKVLFVADSFGKVEESLSI